MYLIINYLDSILNTVSKYKSVSQIYLHGKDKKLVLESLQSIVKGKLILV